MSSLRCILARTVQEIMDAQHVRWRVYGDEEALLPASLCHGGREIDARDARDTTTHVLVYAGEEPVGTVRLLEPDADIARARGDRLGLDLDSKFDLGALSSPGISPAEVTRFCVVRAYRHTAVTAALFSALYNESARRGITHWVAGANMETDFAEDAALAYRVAHEKKLMSARFQAEPRACEPHPTPRRRPYYTEAQRRRADSGDLAGIEPPRTLALFAARMAARYIGPPVFDPYFNVFALPLVAALADIGPARAPRGSRTYHLSGISPDRRRPHSA